MSGEALTLAGAYTAIKYYRIALIEVFFQEVTLLNPYLKARIRSDLPQSCLFSLRTG